MAHSSKKERQAEENGSNPQRIRLSFNQLKAVKINVFCSDKGIFIMERDADYQLVSLIIATP
jgi:hypothetical protein